MTLPTIHLNGTNRRDLYEQYDAALDAVRTAIEKLRLAWPNGRDYYPQGDTVLYAAQDEHQARIDKLVRVRKELEEILEYVVRAPGPNPL